MSRLGCDDVCTCGDYRSSHKDGTGACQICSWNGPVPCDKFQPKPAPACEAPAERKIKVPNLRAFDRSAKGDFSLFSERHCCICGKEIKNTAEAEWILLTRAEDGAFEAAILHPSDATEGERKAGLWVAPIGADCLHKNAKLKPFLLGRELAASVPPPRSL